MADQPVIMVAGCGDIGSRMGLRLSHLGWAVYGLRRYVANLIPEILPVPADLNQPGCPPGWPRGTLDYLVYCAAPGDRSAMAYQQAYVDGPRRVLDWLATCHQQPRRILLVSSTGVYGQQAGEWVTEESPAQPGGFSGQCLLEAEQQVLACAHPATVVRLAGIYGPGRHHLLAQARQGCRVEHLPVQYSNRIHADDAAGLLAFLLQADMQGQPLADCYLGVDDEPAPLHEVVSWLQQQMGVSATGHGPGRRAGNRRCSNARARALGWVPQYPGYRQGYATLLRPCP